MTQPVRFKVGDAVAYYGQGSQRWYYGKIHRIEYTVDHDRPTYIFKLPTGVDFDLGWDNAVRGCRNCCMPEILHADGKCLFSATRFA